VSGDGPDGRADFLSEDTSEESKVEAPSGPSKADASNLIDDLKARLGR
jgi:hypothetical protein